MNQINHQVFSEIHQLKPIRTSTVMACGHYLPEQSVSSTDLMDDIGTEQKYGLPTDWMNQKMGIHARRMVELDMRPSDLAVKAAERALAQCDGLAFDEIDAVIFCGIERDMPEPATAHFVQHKLGLKAQHVFDVANACFGFFEGVKLASSLIEAGAVRYALVVTGEVSTKVSRVVADQLKRGVPSEKAKHLWGMLSVGDAAGAMVLGPSHSPNTGFVKFTQISESQYASLCHYNWTESNEVEGQMKMAQIVARGLKLNKKLYRQAMQELKWPKVDWLLAHQTGRVAFEEAVKLHQIGESRFVKTFDKLGNITTATLPLSFNRLISSGKLKAGDKISGLFAGSGLVAGQFGYVV